MGEQLWNVWRVHYATYAEVLTMGDKQQEIVSRNLTYEQAKKMVEELGFGYCMKPAGG